MLTFAVAVLVLGFLVFIHELGHFVAAKMSGMRVEEFSIGMGPTVASIKRGETEYIIGAIPAGGYVMVSGLTAELDDETASDDPRLYQNRPIVQRALFAVAGPFMNILLTIVILTAGAMFLGVAEPQEGAPAMVADLADDSPAAQAGLQVDDEILSLNGQAVQGLEETHEYFQALDSGPVELVIRRAGEEEILQVTPRYDAEHERYLIGITLGVAYDNVKQAFPEALNGSLKMTVNMSTMILDAVGNLITGEASVSDDEEGLTGPVGIVKIIDQSAQEGFWAVMILMGILSVNLGLLNLLPIPALDGSRLLFLFLEAVRGRPVSPEKEGFVNFTGFVLLMFLMIYVTYNDILRLLS